MLRPPACAAVPYWARSSKPPRPSVTDTGGPSAGGNGASHAPKRPHWPSATQTNGADAGRRRYSDEDLADWIANGAGRDDRQSLRKRMGWLWALYMLAVGPFLLLTMVFTALARLLLPSRVPVWGFARRTSALRYLLAVGAVVGVVVLAVLLVNDGLSFPRLGTGPRRWSSRPRPPAPAAGGDH